jgi:putative addiction module killer protein
LLSSIDYNGRVYTLKPLPTFTDWLSSLKDGTVRGAVLARLKRLAHGLPGDAAPIGEGLSELRIHLGAGWRVYYVPHGQTVIVLLCGGAKKTQPKDILRAKALAKQLT